ncbi:MULTISPECIES: TetR family transcriptional regulator [Nostoc]|uniref:TetR family transcriptional regulator n=1 Tax=Nostoc paludosum FACHB-159 TaxID=2692908 RepID=A0ABR8K1Y5_9NOSO|nr:MULTISPECIES: TetR family transcriptional regulator [Nostoc]MBD2678313.1 TetR family transcriptional regulator [Nostoc sp. FACHB-857]MBD2733431.1 TetR family transcriptional regulator [Nostoc paludosum FACHB-159]
MPSSQPAKSKRSSSVHDAEATKARILDAAEKEFAIAGLAATRTETIAAQTGVTKTMIYYYYQNKEALYQEVLNRAFIKPLDEIVQLDLEQLPPQAALESFTQLFLEQTAKNPNIPSILFLEAIQNRGKYYPKESIEQIYGKLIAILEQGIAEGVFRPLDPRHMAVNIIGTCVFYVAAYENVKHLWPGKRMLSKGMLHEHSQEALNFVLAGVRPDSTEAGNLP